MLHSGFPPEYSISSIFFRAHIGFLEGGKGIYFNAFEIKKLEEKNQADHVSAHLIEVVVAHLRKKHGADVANGPSAAMNAQQVLIYHMHC